MFFLHTFIVRVWLGLYVFGVLMARLRLRVKGKSFMGNVLNTDLGPYAMKDEKTPAKYLLSSLALWHFLNR